MRPIRARVLALVLTAPLTACGDGETGTTDSTSAATDPASTDTSGPATVTGDPVTTTEDPTSTGTAAPTSTTDATTATTTTASTATTTTDTTGDPSAGESTGDTGDTNDTGDTGGTGDTGDTGAAQELPPIESAEVLEAWLVEGSYKTWAAESGVHPSTGPHAGNVRTFVNAVALASLAADNAEHPKDSATVKELYGGGIDEIIGYAVSLKTAPESQGGGTWYWYERIDANIFADGLGVGLCTNCHGGGADYILTPYPLQ